jgi:hypothetical protein
LFVGFLRRILAAEMSADEVFITALCGMAAVLGLGGWFVDLARFRSRSRSISLLLSTPFALLGLLFLLLRNFASFDVRDSETYLLMYMAVGAGWLGTSIQALPLWGLSTRDDALERGNNAAATAIAGALAGLMACFGGGNIGDGPGWWVVFFAGILAASALWILWAIFDRVTRIADRITIDRDEGSGLRGGAFLASAGIVLGRAVAGDWISAGATVADFMESGWPALIILALAIGFERTIQPAYERRAANLGTGRLIPAVAMLGTAAVTLVLQGAPK